MENQSIKRDRGRLKVLTVDEIRKRKTKLMLNKEWYCDICETGRNYTLAGKWCHIKTQMHKRIAEKQKIIDKLTAELE